MSDLQALEVSAYQAPSSSSPAFKPPQGISSSPQTISSRAQPISKSKPVKKIISRPLSLQQSWVVTRPQHSWLQTRAHGTCPARRIRPRGSFNLGTRPRANRCDPPEHFAPLAGNTKVLVADPVSPTNMDNDNLLVLFVKYYIHDEYKSSVILSSALYLDHTPISQQETGAVARMTAKVQQDLPYFRQFEHGWSIRNITRIYLSDEQTRKGRDKEAEARAYPAAQPTTTQPSTAAKPTKTEGGGGESDGDDASGEEDQPLSKKKPLPKKKAVKMVLSESEEDSGKEDDANEKHVDADYTDNVDINESDSDLELLANRPRKPPTKKPENKPPVSKKRKAEEPPAPTGSHAKKTKIKKSVKADATLTPPPSAKRSETVKIPLVWSALPKTCPSVFCNHPLPATPVPRLLALFQCANDLEKTDGPQAKGLAFTHLEICSAIAIERRRSAIVALAKRRDWPATIDWGDVRTRIFSAPLDKQIPDPILDPQTLKECPIWTDFLTTIFLNDNFQPAIKHKSCGQCFVAENEEDHDLETSLFNTIYSIINEAPERYGDNDYDDSDDSKYLKINDFITFLLAAPPPSAHKDIVPPLSLRKDAAAASPPSPAQGLAPPRYRPRPKAIFKGIPSISLVPPLKASAHFLGRRYVADRIQIRLPAAKIIPEVELTVEDFVPKTKGTAKAVSGAAKAEKAEGRDKKEKKTKKEPDTDKCCYTCDQCHHLCISEKLLKGLRSTTEVQDVCNGSMILWFLIIEVDNGAYCMLHDHMIQTAYTNSFLNHSLPI
ncbi:hypothetical protein B0H14DRAFT_2599878 [Mycena olivaceomarginata]|nr:hypothetical protein B0H14DRAFT_2599878 [Mycena olivaceomarginata]